MSSSSSLTPASRNAEATSAANREGLVNGVLTLIPMIGVMTIAMKNPAFVKRTNMQSRTAMTIMPAMFISALTAENKLSHKMREMAQENRHSNQTVEWAEAEMKQQRQDFLHDPRRENETLRLTELYKQSVAESGVCIIPQLAWYHNAANYAAENPIKILAGAAIPSVAAIFYGRAGKEHLDFSVKLMHTRVYGQFATVSLLLTVMGFKDYMDRNGQFITEEDAADRVEEMHRVRAALMLRLEHERQVQEAQRLELEQAHEQDLHSAEMKKERKEKKSHKKVSQKDHQEVLVHA
jgi:hypothetical protein